MLVKFFDGDVVKETSVRTKLIGKEATRRDARGRVVTEIRVDEDKGLPPKVDPTELIEGASIDPRGGRA